MPRPGRCSDKGPLRKKRPGRAPGRPCEPFRAIQGAHATDTGARGNCASLFPRFEPFPFFGSEPPPRQPRGQKIKKNVNPQKRLHDSHLGPCRWRCRVAHDVRRRGRVTPTPRGWGRGQAHPTAAAGTVARIDLRIPRVRIRLFVLTTLSDIATSK